MRLTVLFFLFLFLSSSVTEFRNFFVCVCVIFRDLRIIRQICINPGRQHVKANLDGFFLSPVSRLFGP